MGVFVFAGTAIMKVTGIVRLPLNAKIFSLITSVFFAYFWTNYRLSTKIFNSLTELPDAKLEKKRKQLLSESIILDGKLTNIFTISLTDAELLEQVTKETNYETKLHMYEMLGYQVTP